jgi:hypothetical protein
MFNGLLNILSPPEHKTAAAARGTCIESSDRAR